MTLDARIERLEEALNAGPNRQIEEECRARKLFAVKLLVWEGCNDSTGKWGPAIDQAMQALRSLPPLPKHECSRLRHTTNDKQEMISRLVLNTIQEPWSDKGAIRLSKEDMELWSRFAPNVEIPDQ